MLERQVILESLKPAVREAVEGFEESAGVKVEFRDMPGKASVKAQTVFDPRSAMPIVWLAQEWRDADVAHEVEHMRMQLVDGFGLFAWRSRTTPKDVDAACTRILTYVADEVVHERLRKLGLEFAGEIIDSNLWKFYREVTVRLRSGATLRTDGMTHIDGEGRGKVCRAAYFVQATLLVEGRRPLQPGHVAATKAFIETFAQKRKREAKYAGRILELFKANDVQTISGHDKILAAWAGMEGILEHVGVSHYVKGDDGRYMLPWPQDSRETNP